MAEAGADVLVPHVGLTTAGSIGAAVALTLDVRAGIPVHELDHDVNDEAFADAVASEMINLLKAGSGTQEVVA